MKMEKLKKEEEKEKRIFKSAPNISTVRTYKSLDFLSLRKDKNVRKILHKNEKIILSTIIEKFNHKSKR